MKEASSEISYGIYPRGNTIDLGAIDELEIEFDKGGGISMPGVFAQNSAINIFKIPQRTDKLPFDKAFAGIKELQKQGGDDDLLLGAVHNAIVALDPTYDTAPSEYALETFFGKEVTPQEAVKYFEDVAEITKNSDGNALKDFLALPEEEQDRIVREKSPDSKVRVSTYDNLGLPVAGELKDNPDFDVKKAKEEHMRSLAEKNTFEAFQYARERYSPETMRDAMAFVRADNWRSDIADAYVAKYLDADEAKVSDFLGAVGMISPEARAGFLSLIHI